MKLNEWKRIELSKDGNNKLYIRKTVCKMFPNGSFCRCSLLLCNALVAIVLIQLIETLEIILEGILLRECILVLWIEYLVNCLYREYKRWRKYGSGLELTRALAFLHCYILCFMICSYISIKDNHLYVPS